MLGDIILALSYVSFVVIAAFRIRTDLFGEQDESLATVLQYMGTLELKANELDRAFYLLDEFVRIRQENRTEPDGDYVNVLFMIGNIHKLQGYEDEAKKSWKEAYALFKQLGLEKENPEIAAVMRNLLDDEDLGGPVNGEGGGRNLMELFAEKVKHVARSASEAASGNRGNQLL